MENGSRGKWALLVGINRYPRFGSDVQLEGCVNDVQILRDALIRRFGFSEERMTVLLDEQATRDGILAAMEELAGKVGEDDVVVFHFSGHGSQQTDGPEADEADGWDETLVPFDSGRAPWKNRDIADDEIHDWLLRLTARTPYVTLI
ncbi:MAG TPA: caspase family protein, partial [Thermoanaerobaculia bacterium]|nr:caspase family protein [Thermoanaerobaculia bacterium]